MGAFRVLSASAQGAVNWDLESQWAGALEARCLPVLRAPAPAAVAAPAGGLSRRADVLRRGAEYRWPRASRSGRSSRTSWRRCRESSRMRCWPVRDGAAPLSFCGLRWLTGGAVRAGYQNDGMCVHSAGPLCRSTLLISLLLCRDFRREFCVTRNKGALPPLALRTLCS